MGTTGTTPRQELIITDLVERVIDGNISPKTSYEHWRIVDYELEQIGPGRGLMIGDWRPGPVTIRLGVEGWHRIQLISCYAHTYLKLTDDKHVGECAPVFEGIRMRSDIAGDVYREGWFDMEEVYWCEADLTGQDGAVVLSAQ